MDYKEYPTLLEHYHELEIVNFDGTETKDEVIRKLMDISYEKKQIQEKSNAIIKEYIQKYENEPAPPDENVEKMLRDFLDRLMPGKTSCMDVPIAFRIAKLLLQYYQKNGDTENAVLMLYYAGNYAFIINEHLEEPQPNPYPMMAEAYLDDFYRFPPETQKLLLCCWLRIVINRRDCTYAFRKYKKMRTAIDDIRREMGAQFPENNYWMCLANVMALTAEACRQQAYAKKQKKPCAESFLTPEDLPVLRRIRAEFEDMTVHEGLRTEVDSVIAKTYSLQIAYHTGDLTLEELLAQLEENSVIKENYNILERCSALFVSNAYYLEYLHKCSDYTEERIMEKSREIIDRVLTEMRQLQRQAPGYFEWNYYILMFVNAASNIVPFPFFKNIILETTVYANQALYVHTLMVKEICLAILKYILTHNPGYLDGVAGHDAAYCGSHPAQLLSLMEDCALFHDIGKYFCLDYISNSSRNLTDDEFNVIKVHPANFSRVYQGKMNEEIRCIYDCALLHHLWYNEQGGYPAAKHTHNQPFVNILSIADSLDAATDSIGRPYGLGKTLADLIDEFDAGKATRYCPYISGLLHEDELKQTLAYIIGEKRKDINYQVYLPPKENR